VKLQLPQKQLKITGSNQIKYMRQWYFYWDSIGQGGAITNFKEKLPDIHSDLAMQTLKDPYCFDFLTLTKDYNE